MRGERRRVFAETNGSLTAEISQDRLNYLDGDGNWQPINLALLSASDGPYGLQVAANDRAVKFATTNGDSAVAKVSAADKTILLRAIGYGAASTRDVGDNHVRFPGSGANGQLFVVPTTTGFEFGVSIDRSDRSTVYHYALDTGGLTPSLGDDGTLMLLAADGSVAGIIDAPILLDADQVPAPTGTVTLSLIPRGTTSIPADVPAAAVGGLGTNEVLLTYRIDPTWLHESGRLFPVTLDPKACIGVSASGCDLNRTSGGTQWFISSGAQPATNWTVMRTGNDERTDDGADYGNMRSLWYFPDVLLPTPGGSPDGGQITSATMRLQVGWVAGSPSGDIIDAYGINKGWAVSTSYDWSTHASAYNTTPTHAYTVPSGTGVGDNLTFTVTDIVRTWYTRQSANWKPNIGIFLKFRTESSTVGELDFRRWESTTNSTSTPLLTINYQLPHVTFDFDPALGDTYSPSTMVAGRPTTLPLRIKNSGSGFDFTTGTYQLGYRWFDGKGKVLTSPAPQKVPLAGNIANNATLSMPVTITTPTSPGQYTLRFDLVETDAGADLWTSDWASPSLYYGRNKKILTSDSTRWTGSSRIERADFPITVGTGSGSRAGLEKSIDLADGGQVALNLWGRDLTYQNDAGVGFKDLVDVGLTYGYDLAEVSNCGGVLGACGWWTNWDERLTAGTNPGEFTYQGPSGNRYLVTTDPDGHLISSAPVLLARQRYTLFDENGSTGSGVTMFKASDLSLTAPSGSYVLRSASQTQTTYGLGGTAGVDIDPLRIVKFSVRTNAAAGTGIGFRVKNLKTNATMWLVYTVGTDFTVSDPKIALGGTVLNTWTGYSRDIYNDAINKGAGASDDPLQVIDMRTYTNGTTGFTYTDAIRFVANERPLLDETLPAWTTAGTTSLSDDEFVGAKSIQVKAATQASSPQCASPCFSTSWETLGIYPYMNWAWKKVGGTSVAIVLSLKDVRDTTKTGTITYYAGPVPPPGATNAIQVSDTVPDDWTTVRRNVLRDAQQVLNFFFDSPSGTSSSPPSQGPVGDNVQITAYRLWAVDGNFALYDMFQYGSAPSRGNTAALSDDDFVATTADREQHFFDRDGLLERIVDPDGNTVSLDYTYDTTKTGQSASTLTAIRAETDGDPAPGGTTYRRYLEISRPSAPTNLRAVSFTERLGTAPSGNIDGRHADFLISTATSAASAPGNRYGISDLVYVSPGRNSGGDCVPALRPSDGTGCVDFNYTDTTSHRVDEVRDPRWSGALAIPDDFRIAIEYNASNEPTKLFDRSSSTTVPQIAIYSYDRGGSDYRTATYADADMVAAGMAADVRFNPDGTLMAEYVPKACPGGGCSAASLPIAGGPSDLRTSNMFDGLARVNTATQYRTPGADPVVSRQGTKAAAKVDNYSDPLTASEVVWTQSSDQYFASMADSGGSNKDLYRTSLTYNEIGRQVTSSTPYLNPQPRYAESLSSTVQLSGNLQAYWRLDDLSGNALDQQGTYPLTVTSTGVTRGATGALTNDANQAMTFATSGSGRAYNTGLSISQSAYTMAAWFKVPTYTPGNAQKNKAVIGDFNSNSGAMINLDQNGYIEIAHNTARVVSKIIPEGNRWYQVAATWDASTATLLLYVDGALQASGSFGAPGAGASAFEIGAWGNGLSTSFVNATIDETAVWSQALNPSQIANLYSVGRAVAYQTSETLYDRNWHPIQIDDQALTSPGFESGQADWDFGQGSGGTVYTTTADGDTNVHSGFASFKTGQTGNVQQDVVLVPGQTFRFQVWEKRTGTAPAIVSLYYWDLATGWQNLVGVTYSDTSWTGHAWDLTVPQSSDGRIRVALWTTGGGASDSAWFDDAAVLTSYAKSTYNANGTISKAFTFSLASGGNTPAELELDQIYAQTSIHPGIFTTKTIANFVDGTFDPAVPDADVATTRTFDAWGRPLSETDQDGVVTTSAYATTGNGTATDVASTTTGQSSDASLSTTTYGYDKVGQKLTTTSQLGLVTSTTYDLLGRPKDETGPDGVVTHHTYNASGQETVLIANFRDGTPNNDGSGTDDVTTANAFDEFGRVTRADRDDGLIDAVTSTLFDLLGNTTSETVYATGGTTGARTTTYHFATANNLSRATATGTRLPMAPASGVLCPSSGTLYCNSVRTVDMNGRETRETNAFAKAHVTYRDFAGHAVFGWDNYVDGVYSSAAPDTDLLTKTVYDVMGRASRQTDVANRTMTTAYDGLGRPTTITLDNGSFTKTIYTAGGRVDRVSRRAASGTPDASLSWTKSVYDKAGRLVRSLDHYDISGDFRASLSSFENRVTSDWLTSGTTFVTSGATVATDDDYDKVAPINGRGRLRVATSSGTPNSGAIEFLPGTFRSGRTYRVTADVLNATGGNLRTFFGQDSAGGLSTEGPVIPSGSAWQRIDYTWSPGSNASGVAFAVRKDSAGSVNFYLDNVTVWDTSDPTWNIPTETAYDGDGRVVASVLPPGAYGQAPMTTATASDQTGDAVAVSINAGLTYPSVVRAEPTLVGYWPLDEFSGLTADDKAGTNDAYISLGTSYAVAPGVDDARTALSFDGAAGRVSIPDAGSLDLSSQLTLEFWAQSRAGLDSTKPASTWFGGIDKAGAYGLGWTTNVAGGGWQWKLTSAGTPYTVSAATTPAKPGVWYFIAGTYDGNWLRLYVDGAQVASSQIGSKTIDGTAAALEIGRMASTYWDGAIDEVALYSTALSASTIGAHYAAGRSADSASNLVTRTTYDALGRAFITTDPRRIQNRLTYDRLGRVTATIANYQDGNTSSVSGVDDVRSTFGYDAIGEMTGYCAAVQVYGGCTPTSSTAWRFAFDPGGHLTTQTPPTAAMGVTTWTYDAGGRLASQAIDVAHTDFTFDGVDRVATKLLYSTVGTANLKQSWTNTYNADGTPASITWDGRPDGLATDTDNLTYTYDSMGQPLKILRGATELTSQIWNPDGTMQSRADGTSGTATFGYDWALRLKSVTKSAAFSGTVTTTWRLDALIGRRDWPNGESATFTYDSAKRPTQVTFETAGTISQGYDRSGNVVSEGRSLTGPTGDAAGNTQTFTYDSLNRVTDSVGLAAGVQHYTYDLDGNRTAKTVSNVTTTYAYNAGDQLTSQSVNGGPAQNYTYDIHGNLTGSYSTAANAVAYTYSTNDKLRSITPASGSAATFAIDALERLRSRTVGANTDTYGYVGVSQNVFEIVTTGASPATITSVVDSGGSRLADATGGALAWALPDLHGNLVALQSASRSLVNALRFDAWGVAVANWTGTGSQPTPWKFQGRLDISPTSDALYSAGARLYDPGLGAFTQADSVIGKAENPLSMNRYLYAQANPATFIDPSGHDGFDPFGFIGEVAGNAFDFGCGFVEGAVGTIVDTGKSLVDTAVAIPGAVAQAGSCALNASCLQNAVQTVQGGIAAFAADPGKAISSGATAVWNGVTGAIKSTADRISYAWDTGDFHGLGRMAGEAAGQIGMAVLPVGTVLGAAGRLSRLAEFGSGFGRAGEILRSGVGTLREAGGALRSAASEIRGRAGRFFDDLLDRGSAVCANSFSAGTLVATAAGAFAISTLSVGDRVLAYDQASGAVGSYAITAVHVNVDPVTGTVVINGETVETTPEHPFYTEERGWTFAKDLQPGMHVPSDDGSYGVVGSVDFSGAAATMYNLTVDEAHTFFVGQGAWLVHNAGCSVPRLLEGEGNAGSYGALRRAGERGDNLTPDHMPSNAYMREKAPGYTRDRGISMNVEAGRHQLTNSFGRRPDLGLSPRAALARDIWDRRAIYMRHGLYGSPIRSGLLSVIRQNVARWSMFARPE